MNETPKCSDPVVLIPVRSRRAAARIQARVRLEAGRAGVIVLRGRCVGGRTALPCEAVREALMQAVDQLGVLPLADQDAVRRELAALAPGSLDLLQAFLPPLGSLMGYGDRVYTLTDAPTAIELRRAITHICQLLPAVMGPLLIVLEELQAADSPTVDLLSELMETMPLGMRLIGLYQGDLSDPSNPVLRLLEVDKDSSGRRISPVVSSRPVAGIGALVREIVDQAGLQRQQIPVRDTLSLVGGDVSAAAPWASESTSEALLTSGATHDFLQLTETIPVGIYTVELDHEGLPFFSFCSSRWLAMLGLERDAVMADASLAFRCVHPADQEGFAILSERVMKDLTRFYWRGRIVVGGETRWVTIESSPRQRPGLGPIWEGVMIDITNQVVAQEALAEADALHRLKLEQKLKTSLTAAAIAHEINQPLSRLLLQAQLAATQSRSNDAVDALHSIIEDAKLVVQTIEKMKILLRSVQTSLEPVDLVQIVGSALLQASWDANDMAIELTSLVGNEPVWIDGDGAQVQLALRNLLKNAFESIRTARSQNRRVTVSLDPGPEAIDLTVTDTGPGWSGDEESQLPLSSTKPHGTGLGLFIVRAIMDNHAGKLHLGHGANGGAAATLKFPKAVIQSPLLQAVGKVDESGID